MEQFSPVEGFPKYLVSDHGRILNCTTGRFVNQIYDDKLRVALYKYGKAEIKDVARLVATHFCTNPHGYSNIYHIDGNNVNNKADNLAWTGHWIDDVS